MSAGCAFCYIERTPPFRIEGRRFVNGATGVRLHPDRLDIPLRWKKPRRIFVNSLSDLFHENVPDEFIDQVFAVMAQAEQHTFQILTKRPERMLPYMLRPSSRVPDIRQAGFGLFGRRFMEGVARAWPLPNVWLGVSVENQRMADERIPLLLDTPAAVRFLSVEPLLEEVDLRRIRGNLGGSNDLLIDTLGGHYAGAWHGRETRLLSGDPSCARIDWVIVGGESGGPEHRRLVERCPIDTYCGHPDCGHDSGHCACNRTRWRPKPAALSWVRSLRDQCVAAKVPYFLKQWGGSKPTSGGRMLDGVTWDEMPQRQAAE